jgi:hypothetical protein
VDPQIRSTKHEIRNKSKVQSSKDGNAVAGPEVVSDFEFWSFVLVSDFDIGISGFRLQLLPSKIGHIHNWCVGRHRPPTMTPPYEGL